MSSIRRLTKKEVSGRPASARNSRKKPSGGNGPGEESAAVTAAAADAGNGEHSSMGGQQQASRPASVSSAAADGVSVPKTKRFGVQKMDLARATGLMGFNSQRWQDTQDPKGELDKALFNRTQELLRRQRQVQVKKYRCLFTPKAQTLLNISLHEEEQPSGKKKNSTKSRKTSMREAPSVGINKKKVTAEKLQDEIIMMHEAYQFLMKKYR